MPYLWTIYFSKALERHIKYIENASLAHFGMRLRDYKRPSQGLHCLLFQFVWMDREEEILSIWCTHDLEEADKLFNWPLLLHHQYHQSIQLFNLQFQRFPILMICLYSFTWWQNPSIWPFYFSLSFEVASAITSDTDSQIAGDNSNYQDFKEMFEAGINPLKISE